MNLGQSIRSGVKWLVAGKLSSRILEFAFGIALARLLVPADFGMVATVSALTGFVGLITSGGMGQSIVRAKSADEQDFNAVFTLQLALGVAVYAAFFFAAPLIADYFHDPLYTDLIRVSALTFMLRPFLNMRGSWLTREMQFKQTTVLGFIAGLLSGILSCLMAWAGFGVWSLIVSGLAGAMIYNAMLTRVTPLRLRFRLDLERLRKHTGYGAKITINDLLGYLIQESKNLVISKLSGPAFLGLFNKGESLSRLPNQLVMSATMQPLFRAMSKIQDDLDTTRYMFHRAITLLSAYTLPLYVGLWWVAEPFILVVYGEKWVAASEAMRILVMMGVCLNILGPCGVLLDAQNRLTQEMFALLVRLALTILAIYFGVRWGLTGVAWALVLTTLFSTVYYYILVARTIPTGASDLIRSLLPGLSLATLLFVALTAVDHLLGTARSEHPAVYLLTMTAAGALVYSTAFLFIPIKAISSEAERWRQLLNGRLELLFRPRS